MIESLLFCACLVPSQRTDKITWPKNGRIVAGGHGQGEAAYQLQLPSGLDIHDDGTLFIADTENHRIVRWKPKATQGKIIVGDEGQGNRIDQLNGPVAVLIDRVNNCLIVSEEGNRRVMQWSLNPRSQNWIKDKVIISDIRSYGLSIDDGGSLYVSDFEKHEVRRYQRIDKRIVGVVVAGGHGRGVALNQLNGPRQIVVDADQSVYVSDSLNHRVMKWAVGTSEGVVVAGGQGEGDGLAQLSYPRGIAVDWLGLLYVVDHENDRLMRWVQGAKEGEVLLGEEVPEPRNDHLHGPETVALYNQGSLYVLDRMNHRVQHFDLR